MSVKDILNKLAEKQMLSGNDDFAFRLVEAADKSEKCHFCDKKAHMMKRKGKKDIHVCKECGTSTKCSLKGCSAKMMYGEMIKKGGKAYCCSGCASKDVKMKKTALDEMLEKYAKKTLTLEQAKNELKDHDIIITKKDDEYRVNFRGGKEDTAYYTSDLGDAVGTGKQMSKKKMKKASDDEGSLASTLKDMDGFVKMVGDGYGFDSKENAQAALPVAEQGSGRYLNWQVDENDGLFVLDVHGTDAEAFIDASYLLKKYAEDMDMEDDMDTMPMSDHHEELDHLYDIMGEGYDAGIKGEDKCPYSVNTDEWYAWQAGWNAATSGKSGDLPDAKYFSYGDDSNDISSLLEEADDDKFIKGLREKLVNYMKD